MAQVVAHHERFVMKQANAFGRRFPYLPQDELRQAGRMGILRAVSTFDRARNVLFLTYAGRWVLAGMQRVLREDGRYQNRHAAPRSRDENGTRTWRRAFGDRGAWAGLLEDRLSVRDVEAALERFPRSRASEKMVLQLRLAGLTLEEAAKRTWREGLQGIRPTSKSHISRERARQLEESGLARLRRIMRIE